MWPFHKKHRNLKLGIDIGTATVKVVALSGPNRDGKFVLENYGTVMSPWSLKNPTTPSKDSMRLPDSEIIAMVKAVLSAMRVKGKIDAVFSIPVFASFITEIALPKMSLAELNTAITFQAKKYVPIELSEVELDWQVVEDSNNKDSAKKENAPEADVVQPDVAPGSGDEIKVVLAAVPRETVQRGEYLAKEIGVKLTALEIETFGLVRSVVGKREGVVCLIDIGARNTNISIVVDGFLRLNRNIDVGGDDLTRVIAKSLDISVRRAEDLKRIQGLNAAGGEQEILATMYPILDKILVEVERVISAYKAKHHQGVSAMVMIGGSAQLEGVVEYFSDKLRISGSLGNPWQSVVYPTDLEPVLKDLAPSFATATGLAMR